MAEQVAERTVSDPFCPSSRYLSQKAVPPGRCQAPRRDKSSSPRLYPYMLPVTIPQSTVPVGSVGVQDVVLIMLVV
jgi:hypothetical protein